MNRNETLKILSVLKVAYPQFYAKMNAQDANATVALWEEMFKDDSADIVNAAVKSVIATDTSGFPPNIGTVKQMINKLKNPEQDTSAKAWNLVRNAVRRSAYNSKEEFEKLPPVAKKVVGGASQLKDWSLMDADTFNTVVQSNFMKSYRACEKMEREMEALPEAVRVLMISTGGRMLIDG